MKYGENTYYTDPCRPSIWPCNDWDIRFVGRQADGHDLYQCSSCGTTTAVEPKWRDGCKSCHPELAKAKPSGRVDSVQSLDSWAHD